MALPHNEHTLRMTEEAIKQWLASGAAFRDFTFRDVIAHEQAMEVIRAWEAVTECIPIIPPGQDDEEEQKADTEPAKRDGPDGVGDKFFEKHIKRVGGPPRPPKAKSLFAPEPPAAATPNPSDEAVRRAIGIASQRR